MTHTTSEQSHSEAPTAATTEALTVATPVAINSATNSATPVATNSAVKQKQSLSKLTQSGWGLLLGGTLLIVGGTWGFLRLTRESHLQDTISIPAIPVETLTLRAQPIATTLDLSGTIRPVDQATLSTRVTGRITQLFVESGDRFRKGEVLAQIDVMDMTAQTSQAQSGVAQAQAEVARSQASLNQLQSQKLEAQAALRLAKLNQSRMAQLQTEGAVARSRLDEANTALEEAQARVAQTTAGIRQAEAAIAQSQAAVNQAESSVTSATVSESYGTVVAPFDGVVVQKLAYEGEMATPGMALLQVENPDRLQLELSVPEENLRFVRVGQSVKVQVDAIDQTLNARIGQIVPAADPNSRSFLVKIPLVNSGRLISGMFGRVALQRGTQSGISIPTSALIQRGQLQGVYIVETYTVETYTVETTAEQRSAEQRSAEQRSAEQRSAEQRSIAVLRWVKTGKQQGERVEIVSGLVAGDRMITNATDQLSDGQPIVVRE